ncbi:MAG: cytochrome c family protein [Candidatus Marinimicrobia bacterium]|nr:cytochrome c family protein [Candidatus Neomarinimicrobiota bacterium]
MVKYITAILILTSVVWAQQFEYMGTHKCKACHSSAKKGAQYKLWKETKHAKAYDLLLTDEAKQIAEAKGLTNTPDKAPECLECHTVGYGVGGYEVKEAEFWSPAEDDRKGKKAAKRMENLKNIGCEICHGPGSEYKKKKTMEAIFAGEVKGVDFGLLEVTEETCLKCHNKRSPSFKPFDYETRLEEIAHPYPPDMK